MIVILSSSKTQSPTVIHEVVSSQPALLHQAEILVERCRQLSRADIAALMKVSDKLADSTFRRFEQFVVLQSPDSAGAALASFQGDVFSPIKTDQYSSDDLLFAQQNLRILSGLYGILRPLDLMQPYRLEMGTRLANSRGKTLYDFWGDLITENLNEDLSLHRDRIVVNCASKEYCRSVVNRKLNGRMLTLSFLQQKNDVIKSIAIYAKRARGMFTDWFIRNHFTQSEQLKEFNSGGYRFIPVRSSVSEYVFLTRLPDSPPG